MPTELVDALADTGVSYLVVVHLNASCLSISFVRNDGEVDSTKRTILCRGADAARPAKQGY